MEKIQISRRWRKENLQVYPGFVKIIIFGWVNQS